jgi:hypothetical protein
VASSICTSFVLFVSVSVGVCVSGCVITIVLISFPFLVGSYMTVGYVVIRPLGVGSSDSIAMGWSWLAMISRSVRSIRLVVGIGTGAVCCDSVFGYLSVYYADCPWNSAAISICIYSTAATILVVFVVEVEVSSCSMYRTLFLRFSIL